MRCSTLVANTDVTCEQYGYSFAVLSMAHTRVMRFPIYEIGEVLNTLPIFGKLHPSNRAQVRLMEDIQLYEWNEVVAIEQLFEMDGGIDSNMADVYFHSAELINSLIAAIENRNIVNDGDRIYIRPSLYLTLATQGVVF